MANPTEIKSPITVEEIQSEHLYGVVAQAIGEAAPLGSKAIARRLRAAEDFYERELNIRLRPTRVFSSLESRALLPAGAISSPDDFDPLVDISESAYDFEAGEWSGDRWGLKRTRYRPVVEMKQWVFDYPGTRPPTFNVPLTWIHGDYKFGRFHIIPADGEAISFAFNSFMASIHTGGRNIPMTIFIDYVTGFGEDKAASDQMLLTHHEDLLEGIRLRTILGLAGILVNTRAGGTTGGSLGLDGMTESRNFGGKFGAYSGMIELAIKDEREIRKNWKRQSKGVPMRMIG